MQKLEIYQSLWGMELRNPNLPERSQQDAFKMVADAGFDGMCIDPSAAEIGTNFDFETPCIATELASAY